METQNTTTHLAAPQAAAGLQGVKRRVVYVTLYELIAIFAATAGLAFLTGQGAAHAGVIAAVAALIAVVWNLLFNWACLLYTSPSPRD